SHVNDAERIFAMRAYWFGRTFTDPLPGWEQDQAIVHARADERSWESHVAEFEHIRASTLDLFRELPSEAWTRQGVASGYPFSVRALAYITAGHADHHMGILRERY
ncbi:MAG: DinB family protein, partial [Acidobacteria bacterium]|nr:DinB family protein [Acidobacteriota bacterium]